MSSSGGPRCSRARCLCHGMPGILHGAARRHHGWEACRGGPEAAASGFNCRSMVSAYVVTWYAWLPSRVIDAAGWLSVVGLHSYGSCILFTLQEPLLFQRTRAHQPCQRPLQSADAASSASTPQLRSAESSEDLFCRSTHNMQDQLVPVPSAGCTLRLRGGGGDGGSTGAESRSSYLEMYRERREDKVCSRAGHLVCCTQAKALANSSAVYRQLQPSVMHAAKDLSSPCAHELCVCACARATLNAVPCAVRRGPGCDVHE